MSVRKKRGGEFRVGSHTVMQTRAQFTCGCDENVGHGSVCSHIRAVIEKERHNEIEGSKFYIGEMSGPVTCKYGCSGRIKKVGLRKGTGKNKGKKTQKYFCHECKRGFSGNRGFEGIHYDPDIVVKALSQHCTKSSLRDVASHLKETEGVKVSHMTIGNWVARFACILEQFTDKITPRAGNMYRADEMYVNIRGRRYYLFVSMDDKTRFWLAYEMAERKDGHNADLLLKKTKEITGMAPDTFVTDGLPSYMKSSKRVFGSGTEHRREIHMTESSSKDNNNKMESLNSWIRSREASSRGFKKPDTREIPLMRFYHNFIKEHQGLKGKTPAEVAGIVVEGKNKWITMIQNAAMYTSLYAA